MQLTGEPLIDGMIGILVGAVVVVALILIIEGLS